jgi:hypothetical protein
MKEGMARFWRILKKAAIISSIAVVVLSLTAALLTYIYEDDIKAAAIKEVNKNLKAKVIIKGSDIHLTFFSTFPNAAIQFENFKILEPDSRDILAEAEILNFQFSPLDFLSGEYHIHSILLKNGAIHLKIDENGVPNYLIFKQDTSKSKEKTPLDIKLKQIRIKNIKCTYDALPSGVHLDVIVKNTTLSGSFTDKNYDLNTRADLIAENITIGKQQFLNHKTMNIDASVNIDKTNQKYSINNFRLKLEQSVFSSKGFAMHNIDKSYLVDLTLKGEDASIQTLISFLPNDYSNTFKDYQSNGQISFNGKISGKVSKSEMPAIDFGFDISNGNIKDNKHALGLEAVNLSGKYGNGVLHSSKTSFIHLDHFSARLNGREVNARFSLDNFIDPVADIYLKSNINLKDLKNFASIPKIDSMSGDMLIDASFQGRIADLKQVSSISKTKLSGKMTLQNVSIKSSLQQYSYKNLNGNFETDGNNLVMHDFSGSFGHTDFKLNGDFKNLAMFLFLPDQKLQAVTSLESKLINVNDFIVTSSNKNKGQAAPQHFDFPVFLAFNFNLKAGKVIFEKFEAEDVTGQLQMAEKTIYFRNVSMKTMTGRAAVDGNLQDISASQFKTTAHATLKNIDVKQLFYEMGNFGQTYFTDKYIQGKMDADITFSSSWNKDLSVDEKSIAAIADVTIYDGEIHKFPQFIALGKFLKVKSLDDISFSEYTNRIYIRNRVIEIPKMDIKSSAVNMSLAGTHTFDNYLDYKMKVNMSQLLFGNKKNYEDEFGEVEVDQNGGMNVFLTMTGPFDNYKIRYDTKSSIKNIGKGLTQEKQEMQKIFKNNSPNAKPGENLNKQHDDFELGTTNTEANGTKTEDPDNDGYPPPKKKITARDSARNNAFNNFRKKLKNSH